MLIVTTQDLKNTYRIEYFHLNKLEDETYQIVGLARLNLKDTELVHLGFYRFYRQAIEVFSKMDYKDNDLMYFKEHKPKFTMPENITDEKACINVYGCTY